MPQPALTPSERQSRIGLFRLNDVLHRSGRQALRHEEQRSHAEAERQRLESAHPDWCDLDLRRSTSHMLVMLPVIAAYGLDVLFFGPTVEYLVTASGWTDPRTLTAARLIVPALFIFLDLGLAILIAEARQRARDLPLARERLAFWGWLVAALLLNGAVVGFVMGTQRANLVSSGLPREVAVPIFIGVTALACLCHALILFGGQPLAEAKAHLSFATRRGRYRRAAERHSRGARTRARETMDHFRLLSQRIEEHDRSYPERHFRPVFDNEVRELINREFGGQVIRQGDASGNGDELAPRPTPDGGRSAPAPGPAAPGRTRPGDALDGYDEERRLFEAEGQVVL